MIKIKFAHVYFMLPSLPLQYGGRAHARRSGSDRPTVVLLMEAKKS